jgi:hypothetical protein
MHNCLGYMTIYEKEFFFSMLKFGHHFVLTVFLDFQDFTLF